MTSTDLLAALRAHKAAAIGVFLVVVAATIAAGVARSPVYTAQARLNVGEGTITSQSVPGYAVGIQSLAASYSRAIVARSLTSSLGRETGLPTGVVEQRLSASPIPESAVINVQATGPSEAGAVDLANRGADALVTYVGQQAASDRRAQQVLAAYKRATIALATATDKLASLKRSGGSTSSTIRAQADVQAARLRAKTLSLSYSTLQQGLGSSRLLQVLAPASGAASDAKSWLERVLILGIVAGAFLAVLAAVALERRRDRVALRPRDRVAA